ncbi:hypothetical protein EW026_g6954 [Hermanssonia centrifuga]|uniref:Uncharacterized protein n=1 Tax=Hermanssonia centrifuga TaxID=98765 RepID=A0A4V3X9L2_9APHY|nr:hypothetical protein EW026_g6954 [Hermanssonia centrifuga]
MQSDELKARDVHRRVQRLKARFSPTAIYTITPGADPTDPPAGGNAASSPTPAPVFNSGCEHQFVLFVLFCSSLIEFYAVLFEFFCDFIQHLDFIDSCRSCHSYSATHESAVPAVSYAPTVVVGQSTSAGVGLAASGSPSPSASSVPDSGGVNVPVVIGIVVAIIVGIVGIIFAVTYFMRRSRKDEDLFSTDALRRQSVVLGGSEHPARFAPDRGVTPRPPSMLEQRLGGSPISFANHPYGNGHNGNNGNNDYYGYQEPVSFNPGQVVMHPGQPMPPQAWTPDSSRPFFNPMGESPLGSPVSVAPYDSHYDAHGQLFRQASGGAAAYLNHQPPPGFSQSERSPSLGAPSYYTRQVPSNQMSLDVPNDSHYVDLNRASVSPFQAEQYAEISHHLNTTPPVPLPTPMVAAAADEILANESFVVHDVIEPRPLNVVNQSPRIGSPASPSPFADPHFHGDYIPKPPSPTLSSKTRVDSTPPMLPEIQQRSFSPISSDFPTGPSSVRPSPSPLNTSFDLPSPPAEAHFDAVPRSNKNTPATAQRPETMYDDDDAYAGI